MSPTMGKYTRSRRASRRMRGYALPGVIDEVATLKVVSAATATYRFTSWASHDWRRCADNGDRRSAVSPRRLSAQEHNTPKYILKSDIHIGSNWETRETTTSAK